MTHNTQKKETIRIIQIDAVINHLVAQEKFFKELGIEAEVYNFPMFEDALPILHNQSGLFDLILIHESILTPEINRLLPKNTTIAIVNASRRQFDEKVVGNRVNHVGSIFRKKWFEELFSLGKL